MKRAGRDLTIIAYSRMVETALAAAAELAKEGIEAEVVDPRTLLPLDIETIMASVGKTHRAIIVHEACKTMGVGAEIGMQIVENGFDCLDAPVVRVAGADVPMPKSHVLESLAVPSTARVVAAARELLG